MEPELNVDNSDSVK